MATKLRPYKGTIGKKYLRSYCNQLRRTTMSYRIGCDSVRSILFNSLVFFGEMIVNTENVLNGY